MGSDVPGELVGQEAGGQKAGVREWATLEPIIGWVVGAGLKVWCATPGCPSFWFWQLLDGGALPEQACGRHSSLGRWGGAQLGQGDFKGHLEPEWR